MELLGTIAVGAGGTANNRSTIGSFYLLARYPYIIIVPDSVSPGYTCRLGVGDGLTADATDFPVTARLQIPLPQGYSTQPVIALYAVGSGGSCKVYGAYGLVGY